VFANVVVQYMPWQRVWLKGLHDVAKDNYEINDTVKRVWDKEGHTYPGRVESINPDGTPRVHHTDAYMHSATQRVARIGIRTRDYSTRDYSPHSLFYTLYTLYTLYTSHPGTYVIHYTFSEGYKFIEESVPMSELEKKKVKAVTFFIVCHAKRK
jgi:hypothetical protein